MTIDAETPSPFGRGGGEGSFPTTAIKILGGPLPAMLDGEVSDRWIPWYFVAFFVVIAAVMGGMVTIAIKTQTGVVTEHPYEKGIAYNDVVRAQQHQEKIGWQGKISYENGRLNFVLYDKNNKLLQADKITAKIMRPTHAGLDFALDLSSGSAEVSFPEKGLWEVRIFAEKDQQKYQQAKRIVVP